MDMLSFLLLRCLNHNHMVYDIWLNLLTCCIIARTLNLLSHIQPLNDMPKEIIRLLQSLCIVSGADEELTAIGIGARISHSHTASCVISISRYRLVSKFIARATRTITKRITALDDKLGYDTMENHAIIEVMLRQVHKVIHSVGSHLGIKFQNDETTIRIDTGTIDLLCIDSQRWWLAIRVLNFLK